MGPHLSIDRVSDVVNDVTTRLLQGQRDDGRWVDTLSSSAIGTGMAIAALHLADPSGCAVVIRAGAAWLRGSQGADGGWGDAPGARSTLFATAQGLAGLALADPIASAAAIRRAQDWMDRANAWRELHKPTASVLKMSAHLLALAGIADLRPITRVPVLLVHFPWLLRKRLWIGAAGFLALAAGTAHRSGAPGRLRSRAVARCLQTLRHMQGVEHPAGGFLDSAYYTSVVCIPLSLAGIGGDIVRRGTRYLRSTVRADGSWPDPRSLEVSTTALVTRALLDALGPGDARLDRAMAWMCGRQQHDSYPVLDTRPGGWTWTISSGVPDVEDTAFVVDVLLAGGMRRDDVVISRAVEWLTRMQNADGSWNGFVRGTNRSYDAPCSVFVAGATRALHLAGTNRQAIERALTWLRSRQRHDGTFPGNWYREDTIPTAAVLDTLGDLDLQAHPMAVRARNWLLDNQRDDGGWGDGRGSESTVEETALAVRALARDETPRSDAAVARGVRLLVEQKDSSGLWPSAPVATHVRGLSRYSDDLMAAAWALGALTRYRARWTA